MKKKRRKKPKPIELKREFVKKLGSQIASQISSKGIQEGEILHDFRKFKIDLIRRSKKT